MDYLAVFFRHIFCLFLRSNSRGRSMLKLRLGICAVAVAALFGFAAPADASPSQCNAVATNLLVNCGFETGNSTGWGVLNAPIGSDQGLVPTDISGPVHSGNFAWAFGATDPVAPNWDVLFQVFATTPGDTIHVSFWAEITNAFENTSNLLFGGFETVPGFNPISAVVVFDQTQGPWTKYSFTFTATQSFSLVYFGGWNPPAFTFFDDAVVTQTKTPEPITLSLFGAGLVGAAAMRRRRAKST